MKRMLASLLGLSMLLLSACTAAPDGTGLGINPSETGKNENVRLLYPANGETVSLLYESQRKFMENESTITDETKECPNDWTKLKNKTDFGGPQPIMLTFQEDAEVDSYRITYYPSLDPDKVIVKTVKNTFLRVVNLYAATEYTWYVETIVNGKVTAQSAKQTFNTADEPRLLEIDGVSNARDMGGWKTTGGRRIRQGCVYRSGEMNRAWGTISKSERGKKTLLDELGIRVDIDLRGADTDCPEGGLPALDELEYQLFSPVAGNLWNTMDNADVRRLFEALLSSPEKPILIHCQGGADRTGGLMSIIEALLGADERTVMTDYELTNFSKFAGAGDGVERCQCGNGYKSLLQSLKNNGNGSIRTGAEDFFVSHGITMEEIEQLRSVLLV